MKQSEIFDLAVFEGRVFDAARQAVDIASGKASRNVADIWLNEVTKLLPSLENLVSYAKRFQKYDSLYRAISRLESSAQQAYSFAVAFSIGYPDGRVSTFVHIYEALSKEAAYDLALDAFTIDHPGLLVLSYAVAMIGEA